MKNKKIVAELIRDLQELPDGKGESIAEFLTSDRKKLLFGAGIQAMCMYAQLNMFNIDVEGLICSSANAKRYMHMPESVPQFEISNFPYDKNEYDIMLSLNSKHYAEVIPKLKGAAFEHIYYTEEWSSINHLMRKIYIDNCLNELGATVESNVIKFDNFKIQYSLNLSDDKSFFQKSYQSALFNDFDDLVLPGVFGIYPDFLREGEYENDIVCVEENDIVLDLGANYGVFSSVAASKAVNGCVYSFEPSPEIVELILSQNAALYDNFHIAEYAVSDHSGVIDLYMNDFIGRDFMIGVNSISRQESEAEARKVKTISVDEFVKENNLPRVDFIKADIEGAEQMMLKGAKETLRKYAPKLSLCTYHRPDDPEVMKKLILEANPNYVVVQKTHKMYAYVPK